MYISSYFFKYSVQETLRIVHDEMNGQPTKRQREPMHEESYSAPKILKSDPLSNMFNKMSLKNTTTFKVTFSACYSQS